MGIKNTLRGSDIGKSSGGMSDDDVERGFSRFDVQDSWVTDNNSGRLSPYEVSLEEDLYEGLGGWPEDREYGGFVDRPGMQRKSDVRRN